MRKIYSSGWPKHSLAFGVMLFLTTLFGQLSAQISRYVISGKVTDAKTKETLPGVAVRVASTAFAMSTNIDGAYSLVTNMSPGQYTVTFS